MKRNQNQIRQLLPTVAIVGDGLCEKIYFDQLKQFENLSHLRIFPELPDRSGKGGGFARVFTKAESLKSQGHDTVFCLIDMDMVHHQDKFQTYQTARKTAEKKGVVVIECNPCFEIWFLLHYIRSGQPMGNCEQAFNKIKSDTALGDYEKKQNYYQRKQIYKFLKERLHTEAVPNAQWLEAQRTDIQSFQFPRCEVFRVIDFFNLNS